VASLTDKLVQEDSSKDVFQELRDVQDSMGDRDPRTTRLYDRTRGNLSRNATYAVAAALADD
jgi:integrase/recombinase XerD